jgi:hypothetical protein
VEVEGGVVEVDGADERDQAGVEGGEVGDGAETVCDGDVGAAVSTASASSVVGSSGLVSKGSME